MHASNLDLGGQGEFPEKVVFVWVLNDKNEWSREDGCGHTKKREIQL